MDPNAALEEIRAIIESLRELIDGDDEDDVDADAAAEFIITDGTRLVDLCEGLDGWIKGGGFLPKDWEGDAETAIKRVMSRSDVCICNDYPHRKAMGCL